MDRTHVECCVVSCVNSALFLLSWTTNLDYHCLSLKYEGKVELSKPSAGIATTFIWIKVLNVATENKYHVSQLN